MRVRDNTNVFLLVFLSVIIATSLMTPSGTPPPQLLAPLTIEQQEAAILQAADLSKLLTRGVFPLLCLLTIVVCTVLVLFGISRNLGGLIGALLLLLLLNGGYAHLIDTPLQHDAQAIRARQAFVHEEEYLRNHIPP